MTPDGRSEMRAFVRSLAAHVAFIVALLVGDWLNRIPWARPEAMRVGIRSDPAAAPPEPPTARQTAPRPRPRPTAPRPTAPPPVEPEPVLPDPVLPEPPEPEPELPGLERPAPTAPRPTAPRETAPRPTAPRATAPRATAPRPTPAEPEPASPEPESPAAPAGGAAIAGIAGMLEGWEGGPGDPYLEALIRRVSSKWLKPTSGLPSRPATIVFQVDRSGRVSGLRIEASSGASLFDRAALRAVDLASPVPPLPTGVRASTLKVHLDFLP